MGRKKWERKPDSMSLSRHRKAGTPGHNSDLQQTARELNRQAEQLGGIKNRRKGLLFGSISELMRAEKKKR